MGFVPEPWLFRRALPRLRSDSTEDMTFTRYVAVVTDKDGNIGAPTPTS